MNIQEVDIRLVLGRLRPASAYHWSGESDFGNTMEAVAEWRDLTTTPPTEEEVLAEWQRYLQEQAAQQQVEAEQQAALSAAQSKAKTIQVTEDDIRNAKSIGALQEIVVKQQALIAWLVAEHTTKQAEGLA
jgi:hypothetical protein